MCGLEGGIMVHNFGRHPQSDDRQVAQPKGKKALKVGWHLLLVAAAVAEFSMSKTSMRRLLVGACGGWHLAAAIDDAVGE